MVYNSVTQYNMQHQTNHKSDAVSYMNKLLNDKYVDFTILTDDLKSDIVKFQEDLLCSLDKYKVNKTKHTNISICNALMTQLNIVNNFTSTNHLNPQSESIS